MSGYKPFDMADDPGHSTPLFLWDQHLLSYIYIYMNRVLLLQKDMKEECACMSITIRPCTFLWVSCVSSSTVLYNIQYVECTVNSTVPVCTSPGRYTDGTEGTDEDKLPCLYSKHQSSGLNNLN